MGVQSAAKLKRIERRSERRNGKHQIRLAMISGLDDEAPEIYDEANLKFYQIPGYELLCEQRRRTAILEGTNPDTGEQYTPDDYLVVIKTLAPMTAEESETAHSTWWNLDYFASLAEEMNEGTLYAVA